MICNTCGNQSAYRFRMTSYGQACDACGLTRSVVHPDVYFRGPYLDPNLVDVSRPEQKDGVWIESRQQKADIMSRLGVREAGDKKHGCRLEDKASIRNNLR